MKKQIKRLRLSSETLRTLQSDNLVRVAGGGIVPTSMECFEATHCDCASQASCTLFC
jgi:hypothetical protein